jgi:uncharacterized protein YnzC (UPF0291/DUF896 family)
MEVYYIDTIEQTKGDEGAINEYGKREQWKLPFEQVESKYFKKLSDVSADLVTIDESKKHYFMDIRIVDNQGNDLEKKQIGKYQE